jgi:membrane-associated phospholipid phosphatase
MKIVDNEVKLTSEVSGISTPGVVIAAALSFLVITTISLLGLNGFDVWLIHLLDSVSGRSSLFDGLMRALTEEMFSNLLLVTLIWYVWFSMDNTDCRTKVAVGFIMSYVSGILSRVLQLILPVHPRPLHDPALHFRLPLGVNPNWLSSWSSFPSDHAAVLFGLAATVFIVNRRLGWLAFALAAGLNCVRIYLGFHFPTDVIGGAALGILFVGMTQSLRLNWPFPQIVAAESSRKPLFYALSFYLSYGIATLFDDYRAVASGVMHVLKLRDFH